MAKRDNAQDDHAIESPPVAREDLTTAEALALIRDEHAGVRPISGHWSPARTLAPTGPRTLESRVGPPSGLELLDNLTMTATRHRLRVSNGTELSVITAGDPTKPALLLLHGFPSSANTFRGAIPILTQSAYVIAPDLPGFGQSDVLPSASFAAFGHAIAELLDQLQVGPRYVYLHDYGAPVGLHLAMREPDLVLGLVVQNANAHRTGFGPQWAATLSYWARPDPKNEAAATAHLSLEGTRDQYIAGVPPDVAAKIAPEVWAEDWRVMYLPGRMDAQRALVADYANHVARFDAIAEYLCLRQPPALMLWGRHDAFFDIAETLSWMQDLPRMECHVFDAGHFLLETHAVPAATLISEFIVRSSTLGPPAAAAHRNASP